LTQTDAVEPSPTAGRGRAVTVPKEYEILSPYVVNFCPCAIA